MIFYQGKRHCWAQFCVSESGLQNWADFSITQWPKQWEKIFLWSQMDRKYCCRGAWTGANIVVNPQRSLWITNRYIILSDTHTEKNRLFELMVLKPVHSTAELHNALSKINNKWANKCLDGLVSWPWSCHPWLMNPDHLIRPDRRVWNWN